jgi:hypothetical protein
VLELPKPPWYRRVWMLNLAVAVVLVVVLVAATVVLGSRDEPAAGPTTVSRFVATTVAADAAPPPTPRGTATPRSTAKPAMGVLWQKTGSDVHHGTPFEAPGVWHLLWSFDCRSFKRYGGGNFKIYGEGAFDAISVQEFAVKGTGSRKVTHRGSGRLVVESVCDRWTVKAVAP